MNADEALLNIYETMASTMVEYALEDSPDEDREALLDSFRDIAQSICEDLDLLVVSIDDGTLTVTIKPR